MEHIKESPWAEAIVSFFLIVCLVVFLRPMGLLMPETAEMVVLTLFILAYFVFLSFIWKEKPADERDYAHQMAAGRASFLIGSGTLTVGIIFQALQHNIDPWLIISLAVMILAKILMRLYAKLVS